MRKAIFWGVTSLVKPTVPEPQPRAYPEAAATLALCAYKGYQNYLLAGDTPHPERLVEALRLERFFPGRVVAGQVTLTGAAGQGMFRRAELAAHFPHRIWLVSGDAGELAGAKAAGWLTIQVHREDAGADLTCPALGDVWRLL